MEYTNLRRRTSGSRLVGQRFNYKADHKEKGTVAITKELFYQLKRQGVLQVE